MYPVETHFETTYIQLENNDWVVLYSDGIIDQRNIRQIKFGREKFLEIIQNNSNQKASVIKKQIETNLHLWKKNTSQIDDITILGFKWEFSNEWF
ncbi:MAG: SpoIIE family protein phosphatase [Bacteroidales bacterium]|nr:SpoIIE family protein phosphatase [Bacteroidales bacterium]